MKITRNLLISFGETGVVSSNRRLSKSKLFVSSAALNLDGWLGLPLQNAAVVLYDPHRLKLYQQLLYKRNITRKLKIFKAI